MLTMKNAIMEEDEENKKDGSPAHSPIPKNYREFKVFTSIEPKSRKFQLKKELNQLAKNKIQQIHELKHDLGSSSERLKEPTFGSGR